jgi:hypothetical protein
MLQGVGNILRPRASLPDDSTFTALILFDGGAGDLLAALAMDYALPADGALAGRLLDAGGTAEAYFDLSDADNWHVYLGQATPDRRIRASVLDLFQADAYLMLQPPRLKAGASIGYSAGWDFEVVAVSLTASLGGDAKVSWTPQHLVANLDFAGTLTLRAFGFGGGLSLAAGVHVETPTPYSVALDLEVTLDLPWPFPDPEVNIALEWSEPATPAPEAPVIHQASARGYITTDAWTLPLASDPNLANDDSFYPSRDGQVIAVPLDARPTVVFNRNVEDVPGVGTPRPTSAPDVTESDLDGQTAFLYRLTELTLQEWAVGEQGVPEWTGDRDLTNADGAPIKGLEVYGNWQATGDAAGTQIELFGDGPFSFCRDNTSTRSGQPADAPAWTPYVDGFLSTRPTYPALSLEPTVVDFEAYAPGQNLGQQFVHDGLTFESDGDVVTMDLTGTVAGGRMSLPLAPLVSLVIRFPEPVGRVVLTMEGWSQAGHLPRDVRWALVRGTVSGGATVLQTIGLGEWGSPPLVSDVALEARFAAVTSLELRGDFAWLLGLSYVPQAKLDEMDDLVADGERQLAPRPLLLPETDYRLTIRTETATTMAAGTTTAPGPVQYAFFRTDGPPTDLSPYLAATVPGRGGGPAFGGYDLRFEFNQNYVLAMYDQDVTLAVVDDNGAPIALGGGGATVLPSGLAMPVPYTTTAWLGALADAGLLASYPDQPPPNDMLIAWAETPLPAARRLEAHLLYRGSPVLRVPFTTSGYPDFGALVGALDPTAWDETLAGGPPSAIDLAELQAVATERAGASGPFTDAEGEQFDRALYDLLGCGTRAIPTRPELTALRAGGEALALLLEFPEPLDWDRLSVEIGGVRGPRGPALVRGREQTRALLLIPGPPRANRPQPWTPGAYSLTFVYQLDTGDGSLPILTRRGSAAPEAPPPVTVTIAGPAGRRSRPQPGR